MANSGYYLAQVRLLMSILPIVARQTDFALKGGTAINFFVRDLPRLSVDIDLNYLPITGRDDAISGIRTALNELSRDIKTLLPSTAVNAKSPGEKNSALIVSAAGAQVTIEPNLVLRGSVFAPEERELCRAAQEELQATVICRVLSFADLYGGKICAALDRQHPRDLFDVKLLLENEGITDDVRGAFVVYLASHNRPMHELLEPSLLDFRQAFNGEFSGMTRSVVSYAELASAREDLIRSIQRSLTAEERSFLISVKEGVESHQTATG